MRKTFNLGAASVVLLMALFASGAMAGSGHDLKPKFGGVEVETKVGDIEIVAKPESIQLTSSITVKLDGGIAKVTLLNGTEKSEVNLAVAGDKLEAKGAFKITKGIALVTPLGKPTTTARFEVKWYVSL